MTRNFGAPRVLMTDNGPSQRTQQLSYALAKQVPDMERGFTISTTYGDIEVVAEHAEAFQRLAKRMLTDKLADAIIAGKERGDGR